MPIVKRGDEELFRTGLNPAKIQEVFVD